MRRLVTLIFFIFFSFVVSSQNDTGSKSWGYKGYAGGMFVHAGYVQSKIFTVIDLQGNEIEHQIKGGTYGLGGKMGVFLNHYFRIGAEGYFSTCQYGTFKNNSRIGWGGITLDLLYPVKKWVPFVGITVGGGKATQLIFLEKLSNSTKATPTIHFSNTLCIINPAVGVEYLVSNRISLLFKMDYMLNVYKTTNSYPQGLRFYLGVHFYHKK